MKRIEMDHKEFVSVSTSQPVDPSHQICESFFSSPEEHTDICLWDSGETWKVHKMKISVYK